MQLAALEGYRCDAIYSDQGVSGASIDRPGLSSAMTALTRGGTLVVWRLDRLSRSIRHLIDVIAWLNDNGVRLVSLTECIDTQSPTGRFTFHMIAALAEFERSLISERTRAGLQGARLRGSRLGRPPALDATQCARAQELLRTQSEAEVAKMFDIHIRTLRRHLTRHAQRHQ